MVWGVSIENSMLSIEPRLNEMNPVMTQKQAEKEKENIGSGVFNEIRFECLIGGGAKRFTVIK